jgi:hypothetical protein
LSLNRPAPQNTFRTPAKRAYDDEIQNKAKKQMIQEPNEQSFLRSNLPSVSAKTPIDGGEESPTNVVVGAMHVFVTPKSESGPTNMSSSPASSSLKTTEAAGTIDGEPVFGAMHFFVAPPPCQGAEDSVSNVGAATSLRQQPVATPALVAHGKKQPVFGAMHFFVAPSSSQAPIEKTEISRRSTAVAGTAEGKPVFGAMHFFVTPPASQGSDETSSNATEVLATVPSAPAGTATPQGKPVFGAMNFFVPK